MGLFKKSNLFTELADKAQSRFAIALQRMERQEFNPEAIGFSTDPASKPNTPKDLIEWEPHRRILKILMALD